MKIIGDMKQPENAKECESIWCEECTYNKNMNCEGLKRGWLYKYALWHEVLNNGTEFDVLFMFDDDGSFKDIAQEGKETLEKHGISNYYEWLGEIEYPTKWEEYDIKSEYKEELI